MLLGIVFPAGVLGQSTNDAPTKQERKEERQLMKDGWMPMPGTAKPADQLHQAHLMQKELLTTGLPKYFMATGRSAARSIDAAKTIACEYAQQEIVSRVKAEVQSLTDYYISSQQLGGTEAETQTRITVETRVSAMQRLRHTIPVMELYRTLPNGMTEVMVRLACPVEEIITD